MAIKLTFELTRPARKAGGDRYEVQVASEKLAIVIYVPQYISRKDGVPAYEMEVSFNPL